MKFAAKYLMLGLLSSSLLGVLALVAQEPDNKPIVPVPEGKRVYATGRVTPPDLPKKRAASVSKYGEMLRRLPKVTAAQWDCRTLGIVPPIVDQGSCGSCWDFSGTSVCTSALIKAGYGKPDGSFMLSEQYTLDCGRNGGCNGDDNTTVTEWCKSTGLPATQDYGKYQGRAGSCNSNKDMKMYKITDWGFCTTANQQGVADTQDIKNAMVKFGPIGAAIAADNAFMNNPRGTVFDRNTSSGIDHDIVLVGWDDTKGKSGAWLLRNSWGTSWCDDGYCWIGYGVNKVGTEAIWCTATSIIPPAPPWTWSQTPTVPTLKLSPSVTITLTEDQVKSVITQSQRTLEEPPVATPPK